MNYNCSRLDDTPLFHLHQENPLRVHSSENIIKDQIQTRMKTKGAIWYYYHRSNTNKNEERNLKLLS